jgi:hypothetical protein
MGVEYPQNAWTRMIERASAMNAETGGRVGLASAEPRPTAASSTIGREVVEPPPLSIEERAELDARARALGLLPPDEGAEGPYGSLEDALAVARGPEQEEAPTVDPVLAMAAEARAARRAREGRQTAREFIASNPTERDVQIIETPRMPDFNKVQGMDLAKGVAYLDGMEFKIGPDQLRKLRKFVVELARVEFMERLNAAMGLFDPEAPSDDESPAASAVVQRVSEGSRAKPA